MKSSHRRVSSKASCSCAFCPCKSDSDHISLRRITRGSRIDKLYYGRYLPLRERKLLGKLVRNRAEYDHIRRNLLSANSSSDIICKANLKPRRGKQKNTLDENSFSSLVAMVDKGIVLGPHNMSDPCSCCTFSSKINTEDIIKLRRNVHMYKPPADYIEPRTGRARKRIRAQNVRLRTKHIRSDPCTCTFKFSGLIKNPLSKSKFRKSCLFQPEPVLEKFQATTEQRSGGKNKIRIICQSDLSKKLSESETHLKKNFKANLKSSLNKIHESQNKLKENIRDSIRISKETLMGNVTKQKKTLKATVKKSLENIRQAKYKFKNLDRNKKYYKISVEEANGSFEGNFHKEENLKVPRVSVTKYREDLAKKRESRDWECQFEYYADKCVPKDCFEELNLYKKNKHKSRKSGEHLLYEHNKKIGVTEGKNSSNCKKSRSPKRAPSQISLNVQDKQLAKRHTGKTVKVGNKINNEDAFLKEELHRISKSLTKLEAKVDKQMTNHNCLHRSFSSRSVTANEVQTSPKKVRDKVKRNSQAVKIGPSFDFNIEVFKTNVKDEGDRAIKANSCSHRNLKNNVSSGYNQSSLDVKAFKHHSPRSKRKHKSTKDSQTGKYDVRRCFCSFKLKPKKTRSNLNKKTKRSISDIEKRLCIPQGSQTKISNIPATTFQSRFMLKPYKFKPLVCPLDECESIECAKLYKEQNTKHLSVLTSTNPCKSKSVSTINKSGTISTTKHNANPVVFKIEIGPALKLTNTNVVSKPGKRVRIGSSFDFHIDFYKQSNPVVAELHNKCKAGLNRSIINNKSSVRIVKSSEVKPKICHVKRQCLKDKQSQAIDCVEKSKDTSIIKDFRKCFCTLKFSKRDKKDCNQARKMKRLSKGTITSHQVIEQKPVLRDICTVTKKKGTKNIKNELLFYECEPGTCLPGFCDPYNCIESIKQRNRKKCKTMKRQTKSTTCFASKLHSPKLNQVQSDAIPYVSEPCRSKIREKKIISAPNMPNHKGTSNFKLGIKIYKKKRTVIGHRYPEIQNQQISRIKQKCKVADRCSKAPKKKYINRLEPYVCEPFNCIPGKCDTCQCMQRFKKRQVKQIGVLTTRPKHKCTLIGTSNSPVKAEHKKNAYVQDRTVKNTNCPKNKLPKVSHDYSSLLPLALRCSHQVVLIGSNFNFNVKTKCTKNRSPSKIAIPTVLIHNPKQKLSKEKDNNTLNKFNPQEKTQTSKVNCAHKSSEVGKILKRCFCTLQLQNQNKARMPMCLQKRKQPTKLYTVSMATVNNTSMFKQSTKVFQDFYCLENKSNCFDDHKNSLDDFGETIEHSIISKCKYKENSLLNFVSKTKISSKLKINETNIILNKQSTFVGDINEKNIIAELCETNTTSAYCSDYITDITGASRYLRKCFCTMNIQVANKGKCKSRKLEPYECEPGVCEPYACNPLECQKLIMKRLAKQASKVTSTTASSKSKYACIATDTKTKKMKSCHVDKTKKVRGDKSCTEKNCKKSLNSHRQAVRVGSSFKFDVEFSKDTSKESKLREDYQTHPCVTSSSESSKNRKHKSKSTKGKNNCLDRDTQSLIRRIESKASSVAPILKRCFCTLKLHENGREENDVKLNLSQGTVPICKKQKDPILKQTRTQNTMTSKIRKTKCNLKPYECEPGVCVVGQCNPHDCFELIKARNKQYKNSGNDCMRQPRKSEVTTMAFKQKGEKIQSNRNEKSCRPIVKEINIKRQKKPAACHQNHSRNTVRIGSTFSFNIEFYKEKIRIPPKYPQDVIKLTIKPKCCPKSSQDVKKLCHVCSQANLSQIRKSTITKSCRERCFCTAELYSKFSSKPRPGSTCASVQTNKIKLNKITRNVEPFECEPGVCIPGQCNPYECEKRIKRRNECTAAKIYPMVSQSSTSCTLESKEGQSRPKKVTYYNSAKKPVKLRDQSLKKCPKTSRQFVRIGSNFGFDAEFFKDKSYGNDYKPPKSQVNACHTSKNTQRKKTTCDSDLQVFSKKMRSAVTEVKPFLKKCFCTLKLHKTKRKRKSITLSDVDSNKCIKNKERNYVNMIDSPCQTKPKKFKKYEKQKPVTLLPYKCEQGVCRPDNCDPYKCDKIIQKRNKMCSKMTETNNYKSVCNSSHAKETKECTQRMKTVKGKRRSKKNKSESCKKLKPETRNLKRNAVRIVSSYNFDVEFYKDRSRQSYNESKKNSARAKNADIASYYTKSTCQGVRFHHRPSQNKGPKCISKGSGVGSNIKRCFCTLKLQKNCEKRKVTDMTSSSKKKCSEPSNQLSENDMKKDMTKVIKKRGLEPKKKSSEKVCVPTGSKKQRERLVELIYNATTVMNKDIMLGPNKPHNRPCVFYRKYYKDIQGGFKYLHTGNLLSQLKLTNKSNAHINSCLFKEEVQGSKLNREPEIGKYKSNYDTFSRVQIDKDQQILPGNHSDCFVYYCISSPHFIRARKRVPSRKQSCTSILEHKSVKSKFKSASPREKKIPLKNNCTEESYHKSKKKSTESNKNTAEKIETILPYKAIKFKKNSSVTPIANKHEKQTCIYPDSTCGKCKSRPQKSLPLTNIFKQKKSHKCNSGQKGPEGRTSVHTSKPSTFTNFISKYFLLFKSKKRDLQSEIIETLTKVSDDEKTKIRIDQIVSLKNSKSERCPKNKNLKRMSKQSKSIKVCYHNTNRCFPDSWVNKKCMKSEAGDANENDNQDNGMSSKNKEISLLSRRHKNTIQPTCEPDYYQSPKPCGIKVAIKAKKHIFQDSNSVKMNNFIDPNPPVTPNIPLYTSDSQMSCNHVCHGKGDEKPAKRRDYVKSNDLQIKCDNFKKPTVQQNVIQGSCKNEVNIQQKTQCVLQNTTDTEIPCANDTTETKKQKKHQNTTYIQSCMKTKNNRQRIETLNTINNETLSNVQDSTNAKQKQQRCNAKQKQQRCNAKEKINKTNGKIFTKKKVISDASILKQNCQNVSKQTKQAELNTTCGKTDTEAKHKFQKLIPVPKSKNICKRTKHFKQSSKDNKTSCKKDTKKKSLFQKLIPVSEHVYACEEILKRNKILAERKKKLEKLKIQNKKIAIKQHAKQVQLKKAAAKKKMVKKQIKLNLERNEYIKRLKRYAKEDKERAKARLKSDKAAIRGLQALKKVITFPFKVLNSSLRRIKRRITVMRVTKEAKKKVRAYTVTSVLLDAAQGKKIKIKKKPKKKERDPVDFQCNLYMASLRKRPFVKVYYMCPGFYPHFVSMFLALKQCLRMSLLFLAMVVWCPCILCVELCRAFLCCCVCTQ